MVEVARKLLKLATFATADAKAIVPPPTVEAEASNAVAVPDFDCMKIKNHALIWTNARKTTRIAKCCAGIRSAVTLANVASDFDSRPMENHAKVFKKSNQFDHSN